MASPTIQLKRGLFVNLPALRAGEPGFTTDQYDLFLGTGAGTTASNKFYGSSRYWTRENGTNALEFKLVDKNGSNGVSLRAPATVTTPVTYTLPEGGGTTGYFLKLGSAGVLEWASVTSGASFDNATLTNATFSGISTFSGLIDANAGLDVTGHTELDDLNVSGVGTIATADINGGNIDGTVIGASNAAAGTFTQLVYDNSSTSGISTVGSLYVGADKVLSVEGSNLTLSNIEAIDATTKATLEASLALDPNNFDNLNVTGISTLAGNVYLGDAGSDLITVAGVTTFTTSEVYISNKLYVGNNGESQIDEDIITRNFKATGVSTFVGSVTFEGGTINLGDSPTDNINVAGEFVSNLVPNTDDTYDIGIGTQRWRNGSFSGIVTAAAGAVFDGVKIGVDGANVISTGSGNLTLNSAGGETIIDDLVTIQNNLTVNGNVTIGGTTINLRGTDVFIENKDIILGYTTSITPTDDTANHAGVAIASTEGTPLVSFTASGINTLPDTYKQMMWFKSGTLGFSTDAFAFNYGVAIGTTSMANGVRLAVGSGITMTDTEISATTFRGALVGNASSADKVKTVTASDANSTYHLTFVDSHNGSATNESVYTDDAIVYNPGTNTLQTQHALFTGNVDIQGTLTATVSGTISTATRANSVDTTATSSNADYYVPFVDTLAGQDSETIRVGAGLSVNPFTGNVGVASVLSVGSVNATNSYIKAGGGSNALYLYSNGDVSFQSKAIVNEIRSSSNASTLITLSDLNATFAQDIKVTGITTTGTLKLNGTPGIGITGISSSTTLAENSNAYLPTQAAVKAYVDNLDLDISIAGDNGLGGSVSTADTLSIFGTANQVVTTAGTTDFTISLASDVVVGTSLSVPTVKTATVQHSNGTQALTIDASGNVGVSTNLTVSGNLNVLGTTVTVNTESLLVKDSLIEVGLVDSAGTLVPPSSDANIDIGMIFHYYDGSAKKAAVYWDDSTGRLAFASQATESSSIITATTYATILAGGLEINNACTGGTDEVISCVNSELALSNIVVDAGTF